MYTVRGYNLVHKVLAWYYVLPIANPYLGLVLVYSYYNYYPTLLKSVHG